VVVTPQDIFGAAKGETPEQNGEPATTDPDEQEREREREKRKR